MLARAKASARIAFALVLAFGGCTETKRPPTASASKLKPAPAVNASASAEPAADAGRTPEPSQLLPPDGARRAPASSVAAADLAAAVRANNAFAVALFAQLRGASKGENLLTSPLSASLSLTMAHAGAKAETARGMASALALSVATLRLRPATFSCRS